MDNYFQEMGDQIIREFLDEANELLDSIEPELLSSESMNADLALKIFRPFHTIKGIAGSFGFNSIAKTAHVSESFLTYLMEMEATSSDNDYLAIFLETFDLIRNMLANIEKDKNDVGFEENVEDITNRFKDLTARVAAAHNNENPSQEDSTTEVSESNSENISIQDSKTQNSSEISDSPTPDNSTGPNPNESNDPSNMLLKVEITEDMMKAFKSESMELMEKVEESLLKLINNPDQVELLGDTFRRIHSFKGNCGIFSLHKTETVSHKLEESFQYIQHGEIKPTSIIFQDMLSIVDKLRDLVNHLKLGDEETLNGYDQIIETLEKILNSRNESTEEDPGGLHLFAEEEEIKPTKTSEEASKDQKNNKPASPEKKESGKEPPVKQKENTAKPQKASNKKTPPSSTPNTKKPPKQASMQKAEKKAKTISKSHDIRVSTTKLDSLNNLVGELVTAKTMLDVKVKQIITEENEYLDKSLSFLQKIINDLQDVTVEIRMVPIEILFKKMIRIVHDVSNKTNKKVKIQFYGEDTEIDKTLVENLADPFVHMIRNAIDHGIEDPETRKSKGKPPTGLLKLGAKQEAGEIWIFIEDDGKGLARSKIIEKAKKQGLISENTENMSDEEICQLIFKPGFSTAADVTDISGRGVGMDVVMQNLSLLRGNVEVQSQENFGTKFIIKLPLTLAIIDGLLFDVGGVKYTIAIENVQEIVKVSKEEINHILVEEECINVRDKLVPIVSLAKIHNLQQKISAAEEGVIIIISVGDKDIALLVDQIIGQHQAVVKPISKYFKNIKGISSCTILGDGEVSLILDGSSFAEFNQAG